MESHAAPALLDGRRLFWPLQAAGWLAFGAVMFAWGLAYWSPLDAFANKALLIVVGIALTSAFRLAYRIITKRHLARPLVGLSIVAISFCGAMLWIQTQALLFQAYLTVRHAARFEFELSEPRFGTLLFYGFVLLTWSLLYFGIEAWEDVQYQRRRAERAENAAQAARLRALQSQLNPHLVFNALNIASTLIDEGQAAAAKLMIVRLSEFLRLALEMADTPEITVADEIKFVRSYLDIEHSRFGTRLQATIDATPDAMQALIPTLILQPLVENSVKHGILSHELGGSIAVSIAAQGDRLRIAVTDSGRGAALENSQRRGIGLSNTSSRVAELYGDRAALSFANTARGAVTELLIPLRMAAAAPPRLPDPLELA